jgi:hypothetical protein
MIGAGFVLVGGGMLLMRGLSDSSGWAHLLPGMIVSGSGAGMVTVPLASTAVGVVATSRAGMASGINATLRQVGLATGIAALGSVFIARLRHTVADQLRHSPLAAQASRIAAEIGNSPSSGSSLTKLTASSGLVRRATQAGFVNGLNEVLLIGALVAFTCAVLSLALIRRRDFVPPPAAALLPRNVASAASAPTGPVGHES